MTPGLVLATGDLAPDRDDPDRCFDGTRALLQGAEICFGQISAPCSKARVCPKRDMRC
jgi:predicted metal-binding transcription factor (methanogenesis marker protein 9)